MEVTRSVVIARAREDVFAYVADARHDPGWCPKVRSVEQVDGDGPGAGARYLVVHRPIPLRPARRMDHICVRSRPPSRIEWREDDGTDVFLVTYELEELGDTTRMTQRSEAELGAPRILRPLMRAGIGRDVARQLRSLRDRLEST